MNTETQKVIQGLEQLAFGKINDAVRLAFAEEMPPQNTLSRMHLMNVATIKRVKGGGVEIQFFDRLKALEKLYDYANASQNDRTAESLLQALTGNDADAV